MAQSTEKNPKDLWTRSVDVSLGDDWRQKSISVSGKGTPNVVDFFRAFAKAYPCEYHDLMVMALDGDNEVMFNHERPYIHIDQDSTLMKNQSFSMRVFYENDKPAALGVCCLKAITSDLQDAYYFRYNAAKRQLVPLALGSDFTGGIVKRRTEFSSGKWQNEATMTNGWGRCNIVGRLVWSQGKFTFNDNVHTDLELQANNDTYSVLSEYVWKYEMELREPRPEPDTPICGGSYLSLPICIAILGDEIKDDYVTASGMEGSCYFYARGWKKSDGSLLVGVYSECAPKQDLGYVGEGDDRRLVRTPHKLRAGDEVSLCFYLCDNSGKALYLNPASPKFATLVGKGLPNLDHNEWRCELSPDNEDVVFIRESDGDRKVFRWNGGMFSNPKAP